MPGKLSTHVLDLTVGKPAAGMRIELWRYVRAGEPSTIKSAITNPDGRTDAPLLEGAALQAGAYELVFFVREYFVKRGVPCDFLDQVPIRFHVASAETGYHVPLLVTPWGYNTYRGS